MVMRGVGGVRRGAATGSRGTNRPSKEELLIDQLARCNAESLRPILRELRLQQDDIKEKEAVFDAKMVELAQLRVELQELVEQQHKKSNGKPSNQESKR